MKAIVINENGGSSQMKYEEVPIPEPGHKEVRVHACMNTIDSSPIIEAYWSRTSHSFIRMQFFLVEHYKSHI